MTPSPRPESAPLVLAGDVGGTRARLALAEVPEGRPRLREVRTYESAAHPGLTPIVERFLDEMGRPGVAAIRIAAACPLEDGRCTFTNLDWVLDEADLAEATGLDDVRLLNDFEAVGHALPLLDEEETVLLKEGEADPTGPILLLGAGTGLGVAYLTPAGDGSYRVHASEGGHGDFGPRSETEDRLLRFLRRRHGGRVSWERVVSGPGLVSLYDFVVEDGLAPPHVATRSAMEGGDPAAVVADRGGDGSDPAAALAMELFAAAFGAQAGNLALAFKATGGVYVAGGIAPRNLELLRSGPFVEAFLDKGRLTHLVDHIPVYIVTAPEVGILGAAATALG